MKTKQKIKIQSNQAETYVNEQNKSGCYRQMMITSEQIFSRELIYVVQLINRWKQ